MRARSAIPRPAVGLHSVVPPRRVGGNLDIRDLTAGTRLYLPVAVSPALSSVGGTHAAQGDDEVCGTAIKSPMNVVLMVDRIKSATRNPTVPHSWRRHPPPGRQRLQGHLRNRPRPDVGCARCRVHPDRPAMRRSAELENLSALCVRRTRWQRPTDAGFPTSQCMKQLTMMKPAPGLAAKGNEAEMKQTKGRAKFGAYGNGSPAICLREELRSFCCMPAGVSRKPTSSAINC